LLPEILENHTSFNIGGGADSRILADEKYVDKATGRKEDKKQAPELGTIIAYICEQYDVREADLREYGKTRKSSEI